MIKNSSIILVASCLFISCIQDKNIKNNGLVSSVLSEDTSEINSKAVNQEVNSSEITYGPVDMLRVFPENLTVDGSQSYFLNDSLFTGFSCHYENDIMLFEIQFKNGRKNGESRFWYKNGQLKNTLTFKNGTPKGPFKVWDNSGNIIEEGTN